MFANRDTSNMSVSLGVPAVRMVVLRAYAFQGDSGEVAQGMEFIPVVALSAKTYPEHASVEYDLILRDDAYGLITLNDFKEFDECYGDGHTVVQLVAAPWPMEEDDERLAEIKKELGEPVRRREIERIAREAGATTNTKQRHFKFR